MLVTCPGCHTKFSLADHMVAGETARVRCSRCGEVFRINRAGEVVAPDWQPPTPPEAAAVSPPPPEEAPAAEAPRVPGTAGEAAAPQAGAGEPTPDSGSEVPAPPRRHYGRWLLTGLLLVLVGVAGLGWWYAGRETVPGVLRPVAGLMARVKAWAGGTPKAGPPAAPGAPAASPAPEKPAPPPVTVVPPPVPLTEAELQDLKVDPGRTRYKVLTLPQGGRVVVLQGEVLNAGKEPRGPVRLKAALVDKRHRPLKEETVYSGTTVTEEELKTLERGVIQGWLAAPGGRRHQPVLKAGETQPFVVVFFDLPANFQEAEPGFQVWPVSGPIVKNSP